MFAEIKPHFLPRWPETIVKVVALTAFLVGPPRSVWAQVTAPGKIIASIRVVREDVFPKIDRKPEFLYRWANELHIVTKEQVIKSDLLFEEGDPFDLELVRESERRLRRLPYIGQAEITVAPATGDSVDVTVTTRDQWTTLVSSIFTRGGGRTVFGGALEEFNLLGHGKQVFLEGRHEPEGTTWTLRYDDPQLFGSRWTNREAFVTGPFIKSAFATIVRPFFSPDTKWAGGASVSASDVTVREFDRGLEINRFVSESRGVQLFVNRAFGERYRKRRLRLAYSFQDRDISDLGDLTNSTPSDELIHRLSAGLSLEDLAFVEETQLDKFVRVEDITLGSRSSLAVGRTGLPVPEGVRRFELSASHSRVLHPSPGQYLSVGIGFQTLFERDTITSLRLRYYNKSLPRQTVAFNVEFAYNDNPEVATPFILGGDTGLRGYPAREFSGNKKFLLNLENRFFPPINILTVAFGGVLFLDAGTVWKEGEAIDFSELNFSAGFGLRLGYTKSPDARVGRIDFALPLGRGSGFGVFVGVGQQFSLN